MHKKPIYRGELSEKGGLGQLADLRGGGRRVDKKEGDGVFEGRWGDISVHTMLSLRFRVTGDIECFSTLI